MCGRARGYQKGYTATFYASHTGRTIDNSYVAGVSLTYSSNPRQHIWSFTSGFDETRNTRFNCPCTTPNALPPPSYVGNNYYCESAPWYHSSGIFFNDTLWDGAGCIDHCCDDTTQPWFYRQLNQITQDDIETRICAAGPFSGRSTLVDQLELYIQ